MHFYPIKLNTIKKETRQHKAKSAYALSLLTCLKSSDVICSRSDAVKAKTPRQQNTEAKKELKGYVPTNSRYKHTIIADVRAYNIIASHKRTLRSTFSAYWRYNVKSCFILRVRIVKWKSERGKLEIKPKAIGKSETMDYQIKQIDRQNRRDR